MIVCGYILIGGVLGANPILERPHIFRILILLICFLSLDLNDAKLRKGKRPIFFIVAYHDRSFILNRKI
jgi:hypothetical protein